MDLNLDDDICITCGEGPEDAHCPSSKRSCGHHCNHVWTHDECCWCGYRGEETCEEQEELVKH